MTAEEVKKLLGLQPHPREGGWYVRTYEATEVVGAEAFGDRRYDGARRTGTAIYYLLEPETFSEMHRLKSDEVFHFYAGDAVEMVQLTADGKGASVVIGIDLLKGQGRRLWWSVGFGKGLDLWRADVGLCWGVPSVRDLSLRITKKGRESSYVRSGRSLSRRLRL